jgi:hypothetical protein
LVAEFLVGEGLTTAAGVVRAEAKKRHIPVGHDAKVDLLSVYRAYLSTLQSCVRVARHATSLLSRRCRAKRAAAAPPASAGAAKKFKVAAVAAAER